MEVYQGRAKDIQMYHMCAAGIETVVGTSRVCGLFEMLEHHRRANVPLPCVRAWLDVVWKP